MDQASAQHLYEEGAFHVCLQAPPGLTFGIDFSAWTIGPRFKGLKLIPPGLHYVYWQAPPSAGSAAKSDTSIPQQGFFKFFAGRQVLLSRWDASIESFKTEKEMTRQQVTDADRDSSLCFFGEDGRV